MQIQNLVCSLTSWVTELPKPEDIDGLSDTSAFRRHLKTLLFKQLRGLVHLLKRMCTLKNCLRSS